MGVTVRVGLVGRVTVANPGRTGLTRPAGPLTLTLRRRLPPRGQHGGHARGHPCGRAAVTWLGLGLGLGLVGLGFGSGSVPSGFGSGSGSIHIAADDLGRELDAHVGALRVVDDSALAAPAGVSLRA